MSSRLFQEIIEKRGLCYSVGTSFDCYSDNGVFLSYAGTSGHKIRELSEVMATELGRSVHDISQEEIDRAKTQLRASLLMGLENSSSRCERLARGMIIWDKVVEVQDTIEKINSVTLNQVKSFGESVFHGVQPAMVLYGKINEAPTLDEFYSRILSFD